MLYGDLYTKYDCIINNIKNKTFEVGNSIIKNDILFHQSTTVDAYSLISPACLNEEKAETSGVFVIRPYDNINGNFICYYTKGNIYLNGFCFGFRPFVKNDPYYMAYMLRSKNFRKNMILLAQGISRYNISKNGVMNIDIQLPNNQEQEKIGKLFYEIDNLITLHLSIRNKEEKRFYKIMYKNPDKSLLERVMEFDYLQCLGVVEQNLEII